MHQPYLHMVLEKDDELHFRSELTQENFGLATSLRPELQEYSSFFGSRLHVDEVEFKFFLKSYNPFRLPPGIYIDSKAVTFCAPSRLSSIPVPLEFLELDPETYSQRAKGLTPRYLDYPGLLVHPLNSKPLFEHEDFVSVEGYQGLFFVASVTIGTNALDGFDFVYRLLPRNGSCIAPNGQIQMKELTNVPQDRLTLSSKGRIHRFFDGEKVSFSSLEDELKFHFLNGQTKRTKHKVINDFENFFIGTHYPVANKASLIYTRLLEGKADFVIGRNFLEQSSEFIMNLEDIPQRGSLTFMKCIDSVTGISIRERILRGMSPPETIGEA
jgi:hypothetical protein